MKDEAKRRLRAVQDLAGMVLDARLTELSSIARAREESLARLAALDRPAKELDLNPLAAAEAAMRYQRWADHRRAEINEILARQSAALEEARARAAQAFGRSTVLARLVVERGGRQLS